MTNPLSSVICSGDSRENGLTSGHYPDASAPPNKCSHAALNKDAVTLSFKRHRALYYAGKETRHMVGMLRLELLALTGSERRTREPTLQICHHRLNRVEESGAGV